jgi:hypothetical protein
MILRTQVTFSAAGDGFTPSKITAPFTNAHDPGEIGRAGRYRGIPDPNGYASFDAPEDEPKKIEYTEAWFDFTYREQRFTVNNQFGEYQFFVRDPSCGDDILTEVVRHCDSLLS